MYGKDSKNVFYEDGKLENADFKTFQVIGEVNGKDKKYIYNYDEKMEINPKDFKLYKNKDKIIYFRNSGKLYEAGTFLENTTVEDLDTFEILDDEYSKDKHNIYYGGLPLSDVDMDTFQIIMPNYYAKDKNSVYSRHKKIKGANPKTIKVLNMAYIKDDKTVFSNFSFSNTLKNADVKSFEALGQYYGKDKNNVYLMGEKIKKADVKTFQVISEESFDHYSKDKNNVYLETYIIEGADPKTFEIIKEEPSYSKDKKYLYYSGKKIDEIRDNLKIMNAGIFGIIINGNKIYANGNRLDIENPENLKIIKNDYYNNPNIIYGKNDKNIYVIIGNGQKIRSKVIKDADINSFEIMEIGAYSRDKNNIYFTHSDVVKMKDVDKGSFIIGKNGFSYDKNSVYFYGKKIDGISPKGFKIVDLAVNSGDSVIFAILTDSKNLYKFIYEYDDGRYNLKNTKLTAITNVKVDAPSFEIVKEDTGSYYKDKDSVFYYDMNKKELRKVEGSDRDSFVEMDNFFAKDNKNVYYLGKQVRNISSEGLKFVGPDIFKNKNGVYFWKDETGTGEYEIIPLDFDSASFDIASKDTSNYFKDKNEIYYLDYGKLLNSKSKDVQNAFIKLEGADIPTFKAFGYGYSKDKNRAYCEYKEFKGVDVPSFTVELEDEGVVVKDKNRVYKNDCE
ncbi:DKNYY domain-containing protein [Leptotrichia alba]|uniref:DKNYY domain-containing protein n=1 Tax=Leptotrichia alba TaxID=3239304 RepID=A0AB39V6X6_9FUSO